MAEIAKQARRRRNSATKQGDDAKPQVEDEAREAAGDGGSDDGGDSGSNGSRTITSELKDTFREAAIEVLKPVMRKATTSAAKFAVTQGPGLVKDKVAPKVKEAGGAGALVKGVTSKGGGIAETVGGVASGLGSKLGGGGGKKQEGESPSGTGRGRRLPVQEFIDVGVDVETAYDQFTQFEDWPEFMHRVERIEQRDETTLMWHENIWGVRRSWEAEITEQTPCERIAWRSKGGPQTIGVVTFHRLSDRLTRIYITVDFQPKGLFEKTASGTRITRRALTSDLMRFKAFIELRDEPTGEWRGRIEDGEVADDQDDAEPREDEELEEDEEPRASEEDDEEYEDEEPEEDEEPRASEEDDEDYDEPAADEEEDYDDEPEASEEDEEDEPEASEEDDEPEASEADEEDDEEAERPRPRRRGAAKAKATRRRTASSGRRRA
jgi:uncharacterized membrane protein